MEFVHECMRFGNAGGFRGGYAVCNWNREGSSPLASCVTSAQALGMSEPSCKAVIVTAPGDPTGSLHPRGWRGCGKRGGREDFR